MAGIVTFRSSRDGDKGGSIVGTSVRDRRPPKSETATMRRGETPVLPTTRVHAAHPTETSAQNAGRHNSVLRNYRESFKLVLLRKREFERSDLRRGQTFSQTVRPRPTPCGCLRRLHPTGFRLHVPKSCFRHSGRTLQGQPSVGPYMAFAGKSRRPLTENGAQPLFR